MQQRQPGQVEVADAGAARSVRHAFCFSLQVMHTRVQGMAFSRASAIGSPQSRQTPKVPFSIRTRASSMAWRILASVCFSRSVDVHFVVAGGLVGHVALPAVVVLHLSAEWAKTGGLRQLCALPLQGVLVDRNVHRVPAPCATHRWGNQQRILPRAPWLAGRPRPPASFPAQGRQAACAAGRPSSPQCPTAATSTAVTTTPPRVSSGSGRNGMSRAKRLMPHVRPTAPATRSPRPARRAARTPAAARWR